MRNLGLIAVLLLGFLGGCQKPDTITHAETIQVEALPKRCGDYDIVMGKVDRYGYFFNMQNERINLLDGFDASAYKDKTVLLYGKYWYQSGGLIGSDGNDAAFKAVNLLESTLIDEVKGNYVDKARFEHVCKALKRAEKTKPQKTACKEELTYSRDWVKAWDTCSGYTALKKDGSLWQFGKVGECGWGQIIPIDPGSGEPLYKQQKVYYLKPKKIGEGFKGARFVNGGYRMYAIKQDGTLWGWGEGLGVKVKKLDSSHNWSDFAVKYEGNGCCGFDVGLKKDGTLWRFPETAFALGKYRTELKLQKIGQFSDWEKIVLGCCAIYGIRKNGTLWRFSEIDDKKTVFKPVIPGKKPYGEENELYPLLQSKIRQVKQGTIYSVHTLQNIIEVNRDGSLCLPPVKK